MKTKMETNGTSMFEAFVKYFGALMALCYLAGGLILLLNATTSLNIPRHYSIPLGTILMLYGLFRSYRVYKKYFEKKHEEDI